MGEPCDVAPSPPASSREVAVAVLAQRQWGVVARGQLTRVGVSESSISDWVSRARLHRLHPGVYAVGHRALSVEGRLAAALFYAGPGAMLSHDTAAWWWRLRDERPSRIHVSIPTERRSLQRVAVHGRRRLERVWHRRLPVTSVAQTVLDLGTVASPASHRRALAEAEYRGLVDLDAVEPIARRGVPGSAALTAALARHRPQLALTRSVLEERFLTLCETHGIQAPQVNATVCGLEVDALWEDQRVIVELDGHAAHATPAAVERDRRRELRVRAAGYLVLRYTWQQVTEQPALIAADLRTALRR